MAAPMFPDHLIFVRPDQREPGPVTPGQVREKAFTTDGLWVGYCDITARDDPGAWHHHANYDSVMYLLSGRCRIDHGERGEKSTIMAAGDFGFFGQGVIHRVQILDDGRCDYVFVRLGEGESVVLADGPAPRIRTGARSDMFPDDLIFVRPDQREPGPATRGQAREKAFETDGLWVGYCDITARDEPGEWHHHADYDSVMYLLSGRCRIDSGADGATRQEMGAGDFGFFGRGVIHRVQILDDGRCDYVFVRLGEGESVVVADAPAPRIRTGARSEMFPDELIFVRPDQREPGPVTCGQAREKAFECDGLWVGYCDITARDEPGEWHHHADYDSVMYLLSGRCRIDSGPDGATQQEMGAGDFGFFGRGVIHRVQILDDGRCDYVFFRFGRGESVVPVGGPGPRAVAPR